MRFPLLGKFLAIVAVLLLLCLVRWRIEDVADDRQRHQQVAADSVAQAMGGSQTLLGPVLQRPCTEVWTEWQGEGAARRQVQARREWLLATPPQQLKVDGQLQAERRYRGLFKVPAFSGRVTLEARWADLVALQPKREHAGSTISCAPARLWLASTEVRGLRAATARLDGHDWPVVPGTPHARFARGLSLVLDADRADQTDAPLLLQLSLDVQGTGRLALVPVAADNRMALRSDWAHPSFGGRFLPTNRRVDDRGFDATWAVGALASPAGQDLLREGELCATARVPAYGAADDMDTEPDQPAATAQGKPCLDTLSVGFIDPVSPQVLSNRAGKYGSLFILLTFGAVLLTEVLARRRVHPVQYALVGLALSLFFLLLLSLSEHLPFGAAYAVAAGCCVALLGYYARHMLGHWRAGAAFAGGTALLYGLLWVLLQMAQTALVVGSLLLFVALAAVMVLTRRVNWYGLQDSLQNTVRAEL